MTRITAILFILGSLWVPFAWVFAAPLIDFLTSDHKWEFYDNISFFALAGYWVWFGWGWHCLSGRFPLVTTRQFWLISLVTHLGWLAFFWGNGWFPPISLWFFTNVVVAIVGLASEARDNGWRSKIVRTVEYGLPVAFALTAGAALAIEDGFSGPTLWVLVVAVFGLSVTLLRRPRQVDKQRHATSVAAKCMKRS